MKKVYWNLEVGPSAISRTRGVCEIGSDLDDATKAVLDKGERNVEILKQNLNSPMRVEDQIAIIFCGVTWFVKVRSGKQSR